MFLKLRLKLRLKLKKKPLPLLTHHNLSTLRIKGRTFVVRLPAGRCRYEIYNQPSE